MAVDASYVALLDLRADSLPTHVDHHLPDLGQLLRRIPVIELEHDCVGNAAVDAGMRLEIGEHLYTILNSTCVHLSDSSSDVVGLVRDVMGVSICGLADAAIRIEKPASLVGE